MPVSQTSGSTNGSIKEATLPSPPPPPVTACPHVGLGTDPRTHLAFPAVGNYCHHVKNIAPVSLEHQQQYCLTQEHVACPVWQMKNPKTLPVELQGPPAGDGHLPRWLLLLSLLLLLATVTAGVMWRSGQTAAGAALPTATIAVQETSAVEPTPAGALIISPTETATATATATELPPTATPNPSETPAPTATQPAPTPVPPSPTPLPLPQMIVNVERLNVRSGPGADYPIVAAIDRNVQLAITGRSSAGDWWQVCCLADGQSGWVFAESVLTTGDLNTVPVIDDVQPPPTTTP